MVSDTFLWHEKKTILFEPASRLPLALKNLESVHFHRTKRCSTGLGLCYVFRVKDRV